MEGRNSFPSLEGNPSPPSFLGRKSFPPFLAWKETLPPPSLLKVSIRPVVARVASVSLCDSSISALFVLLLQVPYRMRWTTSEKNITLLNEITVSEWLIRNVNMLPAWDARALSQYALALAQRFQVAYSTYHELDIVYILRDGRVLEPAAMCRSHTPELGYRIQLRHLGDETHMNNVGCLFKHAHMDLCIVPISNHAHRKSQSPSQCTSFYRAMAWFLGYARQEMPEDADEALNGIPRLRISKLLK